MINPGTDTLGGEITKPTLGFMDSALLGWAKKKSFNGCFRTPFVPMYLMPQKGERISIPVEDFDSSQVSIGERRR
jgi:hypothetical protein